MAVTGDKAAFDEWREARRKRALQIVLAVIIGWNLLFIPLGIYMWPRSAQPTKSPATVFFSDLTGPTDIPVVVDEIEPAARQHALPGPGCIGGRGGLGRGHRVAGRSESSGLRRL